jgi:general secretion pathway protein D
MTNTTRLRKLRLRLRLQLPLMLLAPLLATATAAAQPLPSVIPSWFQPQARAATAAPGDPATAAVVTTLGPSPFAQAAQPITVVPLRYADVSEIAGLLAGNLTIKPNDGFVPQEPNFGSSGTQTYYGGGGSTLGVASAIPSSAGFGGSTEPIGQNVSASIGIDRRLNAIVLRGLPDEVAAIRVQIAKLDVPVESVLLETEFVELTESGARNLGLDLNNSNGQIASGLFTFSKGFPGLSDTPNAGGLAANFQVALYAQIARGEGRIVSKPRISAQSGTIARIVTGDALPILTSIALSGINAVQQQVQYVNVGVTLQIAPRVSDDGFVTSHVFAVVSSVTGYSQGYPTISQREAATSATVRDGEPFVIGGLTQESNIANRSKIPLLGDVPLVGKLFQVEHTNKTKRELYIVVTPHIVRKK